MDVPQKAALMVCDMQVKFEDTICHFSEIESNICVLVDLFKVLSLPILVTTQNKARLGETVRSIASALPSDAPSFDKFLFSMTTPETVEWLERTKPEEIVLVGIETHICVAQTALDLQRRGFKVTIISDAASSSYLGERRTALRRLQIRGINITSLEAWIFEAAGSAKHPRFSAISKMLKSTKESRTEAIKALL